jgi:hypothetical protein
MPIIVGLVVAVLLVGALVHWFWWIVAAAAAYWAWRGGWRMWHWHRAQTAARAHRRAELAARAKIQHRWYVDGDPRGIYGRYTPAMGEGMRW